MIIFFFFLVFLFSGINFSDGFRDHKLLELGDMHRADCGGLAEKEELPCALPRLNVNLHPAVFGAWRLFLHQTKRKLSATRNRHDHRPVSEHLLLNRCPSTLPITQAARTKLPGFSARDKSTTTNGRGGKL